MITELWTHDAGFRYVRHFLVASGFVVSPVIPQHHEFHCVLRTNLDTFYCLFKKGKRVVDDFGNVSLKPNWFWKFPDFFRDFLSTVPDLNGAGESINVDCLEFAIEKKYTLLFVYGDGSIYTIDPRKIWRIHELALKTYPGMGLMRTQDKTNEYKVAFGNGVKENINEATISFPVKMLERVR